MSRITRFCLTYGSAVDAGPSHVFFKSQRDGLDPRWNEFGPREVSFYNLVAVATPGELLRVATRPSPSRRGPGT